MKANELTACRGCGQKLNHNGSPLFYRVTIEPFVLDAAAIQRRMGEEAHMGALAGVLGLDEDIAQTVEGAGTKALVCMECVTSGKPIAAIWED